MKVDLCRITDYYAFRRLYYTYLSEADDFWHERPNIKEKVLNIDRFLEILLDEEVRLLLFREDSMIFGYGFLTIASDGLLVYQSYCLPEFYDSFPKIMWGVMLGKAIGQIPDIVSFECNKANLLFHQTTTQAIVCISDHPVMQKLTQQTFAEASNDLETLRVILRTTLEGERRDSNTPIENALHTSNEFVTNNTERVVNHYMIKLNQMKKD